MKVSFSPIAFAAATCLFFQDHVNGHGYMYSPRSRNWVAHVDGTDGSEIVGVPHREYCHHCLNTKAADDVCGIGNVQSYDDWLDSAGNPMPWNDQATYTEGDTIEIKSFLSTPHWGHQDVMICVDGNNSTQECFETHPLEFVEDLSYEAPKDPNYPNRGYFTDKYQDFTMKFKLPEGVTGDRVMMQWRYVTANSCWPQGYENYPYEQAKGANSLTCTYPLDPTGAVGSGMPEQFWNCAEITILPKDPTPPPVPTAPTATPPTSLPTLAPIAAPTEPACCSWPPYEECSQPENVWCQESQERCEGSCSGKWLGGGYTPSPTTSSPVSSPTTTAPVPVTPSPTSSPSIKPTTSVSFSPTAHPTKSSPTTSVPTIPVETVNNCCTWNLYNCGVDEWCNEKVENCHAVCGGVWIEKTSLAMTCLAKYQECDGNIDACCDSLTCQGGSTYKQCL